LDFLGEADNFGEGGVALFVQGCGVGLRSLGAGVGGERFGGLVRARGGDAGERVFADVLQDVAGGFCSATARLVKTYLRKK
jgi:hypothetical protein